MRFGHRHCEIRVFCYTVCCNSLSVLMDLPQTSHLFYSVTVILLKLCPGCNIISFLGEWPQTSIVCYIVTCSRAYFGQSAPKKGSCNTQVMADFRAHIADIWHQDIQIAAPWDLNVLD